MKDLITIDEVCEILKLSKRTVYRRAKKGTFPKPKKVARTAARGPKKVNRWERGEVIGWLLKSNDHKWSKHLVKELKDVCSKLDKAPVKQSEMAEEIEPGITALFDKEALQPDDAARLREGANDLYDFEPVEEPSKTKRYMAQAFIAALLAGLAVMSFNVL